MTDTEINAFASATALEEADALEATLVPAIAKHFRVLEDGTEVEITEQEFLVTSEGTVATELN